MAGKNLAIKGPPGTGKSETITNLIAAALSAGKRVLFLAEKMAALNVVKDRLDQAGLGIFVLELHSTKAKKKDLLKNLAQRLEQQKKIRPPARIAEERWELERLKRTLTKYVNLLNTPFGITGKTVQEILWAVQRARRNGFPEAIDRVVLDHVVDLTLKDLERGQQALTSLENVWSEISVRWNSPDLHPWSWVEAVLSPFENEELVSATKVWRDQVVQLISIATEANEISVGISVEAPTTAQLETVRNTIASLPHDVPDNPDTRLLAPLQDSDLRRQVRVYHDLCVQRDAIQRRLSTVVLTIPPTSRHKDIAELAELVSVLGASERSVGEMQDIKREAEQAHKEWEAIQRACNELKSVLGVASCETHSDLKLALEAVALVGATPKSILGQRRPKLAEEEAEAVLRWALGHCRELSEKRGHLEKQFDLRRAGDHAQLRRSAFVLRESNFLRRLGSTYRQAKRTWRDLTFAPRKLSRETMAQELEKLAAHLEEVTSFVSHRQISELLGPHFDGLNTDFETFLRTSEFLISARKLTAGTDDLRSGLRALLLGGQLEDLDQVCEVAQSETIRALRRGLEVLSARKAESLRDAALEIDRCVQAASRLASVTPEIDIVPSIKLKCLEQLAEDLAELVRIEAERRALSAVEEAIGATGLDPVVDMDVVKITVDFGDDLAAALPGDQPALTQYLFSEAVKERLPRLKALGSSIESRIGAKVAARQQVLRLAGTSAGFFGAEFSRMPLDALMTRLDRALEKTEELTAWDKFIRVKTEVVNERLWEII